MKIYHPRKNIVEHVRLRSNFDKNEKIIFLSLQKQNSNRSIVN